MEPAKVLVHGVLESADYVTVEEGVFGKGCSDHEAEISLNKSSVRPRSPVPRCSIKYIGRWGAGVGAPHPQRKILGICALFKGVGTVSLNFAEDGGAPSRGPISLERGCAWSLGPEEPRKTGLSGRRSELWEQSPSQRPFYHRPRNASLSGGTLANTERLGIS